MISLLALLLMVFLNTTVYAQTRTLSGVVSDMSGEPIIGASILVKGTSNGVSTDLNGRFTLQDVSASTVLIVSYIGMKTQEITVGSRTVLNIEMQDESVQLEEMVVIGYGIVKKSDLTGAVSVVKPDDFKNKTNNSIGDALQGLAAGVSVRSGGDIGSVPTIQIRGTGNLTNNDPLYVIDGIPTANDVNFNVNDIESIQILKDASAAAIYGSRAANGVVIITTKRGEEGKTKIEFTSQLAIQTLPTVKYAGAEEWKKLYNEAFDNAIALGVEGVTARMDHWDNNTDWQDAFFKTGVRQSYDLAYSSGGTRGTYRASFSYMNNSGTTISRSMERFTARINSNAKLGLFTLGENISAGKTQISNTGGTITDVVRMIPTIPIYDDSASATTNGYGRGNLTHARSLGNNPVAAANNGASVNEVLFLRGTAYAEAKLFPWLTYKLNLGIDLTDSSNNTWRNGYATALNGTDGNSTATSSGTRNTTYLIENTISFNKKFSKHNIDAVAGNSYQRTDLQNHSASQQNLIKTSSGDFLHTVSAGTTDAQASGMLYQAALISYLGRINYDYDGKYLLSLTGRIDGSSRFADGYRWGTFPSVSVGWRISQESFFDVEWINDLKLRANWGNLGSQNVGYYDYQMFVNNYAQYLFNGDGKGATNGQSIVQLANQNLSWERMEQKNIGLDLAFLSNRLQVSAEYYIATSHDVLTPLQLLMTTGNGGSNPYVNAASIENKGFEFSATWREKLNSGFSYSASINVSHSKNKLKKFGYGKTEQYDGRAMTSLGQPVGMFYLIRTDGLFQTQEEVNNYKSSDGTIIQPNAGPGDVKYIDDNDDGTITTADRVVAGSPWPDFEYGINLSASYKNFDFSLSGYGKAGVKVYNDTRRYISIFQDCAQAPAGYDYWTPQNTGSRNPRLIYGDGRNTLDYSDRWLEKGDFFRISNISLGYNWQRPAIFKNMVENIRVSVAGQNLITITPYKGYDPDFQGSLFEPGVDYSSFPSPKSVIFSLNVIF